MKKRILSMILAVMLVLPVFGAFSVFGAEAPGAKDYLTEDFADEQAKLDSMDKYAENDSFELYASKLSGEIGIKNKVTGEIMLSNPYNVSKSGIDLTKQQYLSTVILTYKNIKWGSETTYYSYKDSAMHENQTHVEAILENGVQTGVKVVYELGKKEIVLPFAILKADYEAIFEDAKDKINSDDTLSAEDKEKEIKQIDSYYKSFSYYYFYSQENDIYILKDTLEKNKQALSKMLISMGYTLEQQHADYEKVGFNNVTGLLNYGTYKNHNLGVSAQAYFKVEVEYRITADGFKASVDTSKIEYDAEENTLQSISILPYFNPSVRGEDKGYTFLPDGSGTLIRYEDLLAAGTTDNVAVELYGPDYAFYTVSVKNQEQAIFPVFGAVNTSRPIHSGFFGIIEKGETLATIVSHNDAYYHTAYSKFQLSASDKYDLADSFSSGASSSNVITVNGISRYEGPIEVKYAMLTPTSLSNTASPTAKYDTSYVGMANYYRDYLIANGTLSKLDASTLSSHTKLFLEVFGSLQVEEKIMTFPVTRSKALTTFNDVIKIHKTLSNIGVDNISFILTGFANGGLMENYPTYLKWQKVLGGAQGFEELMKYANENGIEIAPNVNFSYSKSLKSFSGFGYKKTAAKALDGRYTTKREYDASIQMFQRKGGVVISTDSYDLAYTKFIKSASQYNITTLATRALGSDLSSDFDKDTGYILREQSKVNAQAFLAKLSGKNTSEPVSNAYNLILDAGNVYSLPYASSLTNVALDSSRFHSTSEAIPFVGMVLHGSIEFSGAPINMEGDEHYMFLKALENGAGLYFTVAMQNTELLKGTMNYNQYYSVQFSIWRDQIAKMYKRYNDVMTSKQDSYITEHEFMNTSEGFEVYRVDDGAALDNSRIVRVEYANGEGFILNYNSYDVTVSYDEFSEPIVIPGLSFASYGMNN